MAAISALPLIVQMIDEPLAEARVQLKNLEEARHRPYLLDDALLERVRQVYSEQAEFIPIYEEQLVRWEKLELTAQERSEVERLKTQVDSLREVLTSLLSLVEELKKRTIDTILNKSHAEVGLEWLTGKLRS